MISPVRKSNMWMFINSENEYLYDKKLFTYATEFSDGVSCVAQDGMRPENDNSVHGAYYFAMDFNGDLLPNIKSDQPFTFVEGRTIISWGPEKRLINKKGEILRSANLAGYGTFSDGLVAVFVDGKISFWDTNGNIAISPKSITVNGFNEGLVFYLKNGKYGYLNKAGESVVNPVYLGARNFSNGYAIIKKEDGFYVIDKNFKERLGPFEDSFSYSENTFCVKKPNGWTYIDINGNQVIDDFFLEADKFSEGLAIVRLKSGELANIDTSGNVTILDATVALAYKNGLAIAEKNKMMGFIDRQGNWIIKPQYERVSNFTKVN